MPIAARNKRQEPLARGLCRENAVFWLRWFVQVMRKRSDAETEAGERHEVEKDGELLGHQGVLEGKGRRKRGRPKVFGVSLVSNTFGIIKWMAIRRVYKDRILPHVALAVVSPLSPGHGGVSHRLLADAPPDLRICVEVRAMIVDKGEGRV